MVIKMTLRFDDLEPKLQDLLIRTKSFQVEGFYDDRGHYAEYDSFQCKPYCHEAIFFAQNCPWVVLHKDSDFSRELEDDYYETEYYENDDGEEEEEDVLVEDSISGVAFITIKKEFLDLIPDE